MFPPSVMIGFTKHALALAMLSSLGMALPHKKDNMGANGQACLSPEQVASGKAIYFITNDAENAVVALRIGKDGLLSKGSVTKTGGAGSIAIDGATNQLGTPDALVAQSSLTVVGNSIFAVNAGSNSLTMLSVSSSDPTCLNVSGQPMPVPGEFPTTVAASMQHNLVCVGTTGAVAGISCANFSQSKGLGQMDALRQFDIGQTTPPVGPVNTVSQTFFSDDESMLFTTVKGDPAANNTGFLSIFNIKTNNSGRSALSKKEVRSSPQGTAVLFGSAVIPNQQDMIFATDASFGAAILSVDKDRQASVVKSQMIDGQKATCWATISAATNSAFVTDVGVNRVTEMSLDDASIISQIDLSANGDPGLIDLKSAGNFVYALSPGNGTTQAAVTVLDVSGGQGSMKQVQHFTLEDIAGKMAMGMAVML